MQVVSVKCPECGGKLEVAEGALVTKCNYCGAESRVQRRTQFLQRMVAMREAAANQPQQIATQIPDSGKAIKALVITCLVLGGIVTGIVLLVSRVKGGYSWTSNAPFTVDINKDGVGDLVGLSRYLHKGDTITLGAWNGKTGDRVWETDALGTFDEFYSALVTSTGGVVMHNDKLANWYGYDATTGKRLWKVSPGENVDKVCAAATPDKIIVHTADRKWKTVVVATGAMSAYTGDMDEYNNDDKKEPCVPVPNNNAHDGLVRKVKDLEYKRSEELGMSVDRVLELPNTNERLVVGAKQPGTRTPQIALMSGETIKWKIDVSSNPMKAREDDPESVAISATKIFAAFEPRNSDDKPIVAAFDRSTGKRLWEKSLPSSAWVLSGMCTNETSLLVGTWTPLFAFDQNTGEISWTIGD